MIARQSRKIPGYRPVQDVRNIQIVKEQKSSKEKLSFRLKTCRATALSVIRFFADRGAVSRRIACYASGGATKSCGKWWSQAGSNRRPPACKAGALPAELWPRDLSFFRLAALVVRSLGHVPDVHSRRSLTTALPAEKSPASLFFQVPSQASRKSPIHRSYQPRFCAIFRESRRRFATHSLLCERSSNAESRKMVGLGRFELPTSPLSGVRSNQLSYRPTGCCCSSDNL